VSFLSIEPQLEAIDLIPWLQKTVSLGRRAWVIVGGESGRKARPLNIEWVRGF
jgi:protein gp37